MDKLEGMMCDAAASNDLEKLKRLLEAGADPNVSDYDGRTGLVWKHNPRHFILLQKTHSPQQQHLAAAEGHMEAVELLLKFGADITITDRWGR